MIRPIKRLLLNALRLPLATLPFLHILGDRVVIFMLHRFAVPELKVSGHDPRSLRQALAYLRKNRYELVSVSDVVRRLHGQGEPLNRAVAFTIDDGYAEVASVAAPLFAEFDCPVTVFVVTGFVDGRLWLWWDQIEFIFRAVARGNVKLRIGHVDVDYCWNEERARQHMLRDCVRRCIRLPPAEREDVVTRLADQTEIDLPMCPPTAYAPVSWDQARTCEVNGMSFGAQTVSHSVLSVLSGAESRREILESWHRVQHEVRNPVPIFCYPNGEINDFGAREIATLRDLGFLGALSAIPGYNCNSSIRGRNDGMFRLTRYAYPEDLGHLIQYVSGVEYVKEGLRKRVRG